MFEVGKRVLPGLLLAVLLLLSLPLSPVLAMGKAEALNNRIQQADAEKGQRVAAICRGCHNMEKGGGHKMGPNLWGIVDAPRARHQEYSYSEGMKNKEGVWNIESLDNFLIRPSKYIPGTRMGYYGMKNPKRRAAVIAYLMTLRDESAAKAQSEG